MKTNHAKLSPSKLSRIIACPASANYVGADETASEAALLGTLKHEIVAELALGLSDKRDQLDAEGVQQVDDALEHVNTIKESMAPVELYEIEQQVSLKSLGLVDVFGTADVLIKAKSGKLAVIDYKFGRYKVDAENNPQLLAYAAGAVCRYNTPDNTMVNMFIVQPTINNYQHFSLPAHAILSWVHNTLKVFCTGDHSKDFKPSDSACKFCPNKFNCEALFSQQSKVAEEVFTHFADKPKKINKRQLSALLKKAKKLDAYLKELKAYAFTELTDGRKFYGFTLKKGRRKKTWSNEVEVVKMLKENNIQPYTTKIKTPYQVLKENPELRKNEKIKEYSVYTEGKNVIVETNGNNNNAEDIFKNFAEKK